MGYENQMYEVNEMLQNEGGGARNEGLEDLVHKLESAQANGETGRAAYYRKLMEKAVGTEAVSFGRDHVVTTMAEESIRESGPVKKSGMVSFGKTGYSGGRNADEWAQRAEEMAAKGLSSDYERNQMLKAIENGSK